MNYYIKVVPKDKSDDRGEWITVTLAKPLPSHELEDYARAFAPHIPEGYIMTKTIPGRP